MRKAKLPTIVLGRYHTGIMISMQSSGSDTTTRTQTLSKALIGASIGGGILLVLCILAIYQASHEESVLGWIVAGILLAWLGVAGYLAIIVTQQARTTQKNQELFLQARRAEEDAMLDDKLSHSFQIVLVQSKVIAEHLHSDNQDAPAMIERALDTINTTASNGMSMIKEAQGQNNAERD